MALRLANGVFGLFFAAVTLLVAVNFRRLFGGRNARRHRIAGAVHFVNLVLLFLTKRPSMDFVVGVSGILVTVTAFLDFPHRNVRNEASGTLDEDTTVTESEMLEHSFYQGLNLVQSIALHALQARPSLMARGLLVALVSAPWLGRSKFPVNSFSKNYNDKATTLTRVMYRVKKYQYLLYKHALLHGLHLTVILQRAPHLDLLVSSSAFRLYWVGLNTSYVMEFFLQTLVKRRYLPQSVALLLNGILMLPSSIAGLVVLRNAVDPALAVLSLVLNFLHRYHDFSNTLALAAILLLLRHPNILPGVFLELR